MSHITLDVASDPALYDNANRGAPRAGWGAVFAGVIITFAVQLFFTVLGAGLGFSIASSTLPNNAPPAAVIGLGTALWWGLSSLIALILGGWTAAKLSHTTDKRDGALRGFLVWALVSVLGVGMVIAVSTTVARSVLASANLAGVTIDASRLERRSYGEIDPSQQALLDVHREVQAFLKQNPPDGSESEIAAANVASETRAARFIVADADIRHAVARMVGDQPGSDEYARDRKALVQLVAGRTHLTEQQADQRVAQWEQDYRNAQGKLKVASDEAASAAAKTALYTALAMLLGAIAGVVGGLVGTRPLVAVTVVREHDVIAR
ncbi:hypothetical protein IGB42_02296 [Andreprevotia sp. IGB-42]|uniref:hypothetical protein n=1 Tax=Andreprevotia sp. IGB-42 TaxID=2497473 RepID=UPI00135736FF|nr:hypothetical protein [Andreprevotia sp. IGB-42]KAF0813367.1 hypothetical protein IGB42_02296 [Andreprevotia sp. IGB-42]